MASFSSEKQIKKDDAAIFDEITVKWNRPPLFKRPDIRIVISGLIGAGKSTLVNSLTGTENCGVGESSNSSYTTSAKKVSCQFGNTKVQVCDTPGFKSTDESVGQLVKQNIYDYFKSDADCNIFIYAIRMSETRFEGNSTDLKVLRELTRKCGIKIWRNAIIVLTNANICIATYKECHQNVDVRDWYRKKLREWIEELQKFLKDEVYLDDSLIQTIPIVAAGLPTETRLETEPQGTSWINNLWLSILSTTKDSMYSQPLIIDILVHKIFKGPKTNPDTIKMFLHNHDLCYLGKANRPEVYHDPKRKRIVGLACSFLHVQKHMLKYHAAILSLRDCDVLEYWKNVSPSVDVLVAGSVGSGKTSLVNSLFFCREELPEGHGIEASNKVSEREIRHADLNCTCRVWDTPGYDAPQNLAEGYSNNQIGLIFFCINVTEDASDIKRGILKFTENFGVYVWHNAVITLTFANTIAPNDYVAKIEKTTKFIKGVFQEISVSNGLHVIPAGYHTNIYVSGDPDKQFWVIDLWMKAISVTVTKYQPVLITILNDFISLSVVKRSATEMAVYYKHCLINVLYSILLKNNLVCVSPTMIFL